MGYFCLSSLGMYINLASILSFLKIPDNISLIQAALFYYYLDFAPDFQSDARSWLK